MKNYGELLREIRQERNKSLLDIQKETGISNQNLSRWERNEVIPSIAFCEILADYYEISLDELIGRENYITKTKNNINNSFNNNSGNINIK